MNAKLVKLKKPFLVLAAISLFTVGCGPEGEENIDEDKANQPDTSQTSTIIKVGGKRFSIPSPIQTAILIKKSGANYNKEILNSHKKLNTYSKNFYKALNMGVYGADLGYITLFEQGQDAIGYLQAVKKLGDDLGVSNAFDPSLMERFNKNMNNKDSLLTLVSSAYRASDAYLQEAKRNNISGLILVGGWIESLYFTIHSNKTKPNDELKKRIAEQKLSLNNVIELLDEYKTEEEYSKLLSRLHELEQIFEKIEFKYVFEQPTTDVDSKTTTINSKTEVKFTEQHLDEIGKKISDIRAYIVG